MVEREVKMKERDRKENEVSKGKQTEKEREH
jgi:hypothetical protein